jgi:hypothetical protein
LIVTIVTIKIKRWRSGLPDSSPGNNLLDSPEPRDLLRNGQEGPAGSLFPSRVQYQSHVTGCRRVKYIYARTTSGGGVLDYAFTKMRAERIFQAASF